MLVCTRIARSLVPYAIAATAAMAATHAIAQDAYPSHAVTIVVPFSAGGGVDTVARLLAERMRVSLKQPVLVENKPGASGMIGAAAVAKAARDGHTLLLGSAGETTINEHIFKAQMQYSPQKDLAPVTLVTRIPNVLVVRMDLPVKSIEELIAYAKKTPGKLTYASSGIGNPQHLNGELLEDIAGIKMVHVPYKGAAGQLTDVVSGTVDMTFVSYAGASSFIKGGRVRALAVTSAKRASFAPDIPAIAEYKPVAAYQLENWFGLFTTAGTPEAVIQRLNAVVTQAIRDPELSKKLNDQGGEPAPMTVTQFREFVKAESVRFGKIVETAKIVAEN